MMEGIEINVSKREIDTEGNLADSRKESYFSIVGHGTKSTPSHSKS